MKSIYQYGGKENDFTQAIEFILMIIAPSRLLDTVGSHIYKNIWGVQSEFDGLKRK